MRAVERDLDRVLTHLRTRIRDRGFTQLEVQEVLGWGRSYISQLLTRQKTLRFEQVLQILNVIDVEPEDFWAEVYHFGPFSEARRGSDRPAILPLPGSDDSVLDDLRRLRILLEALVTVLQQKGLITDGEFDDAVRRFRPAAP